MALSVATCGTLGLFVLLFLYFFKVCKTLQWFCVVMMKAWPNFGAITRSKESALIESVNSALLLSVFHGLAGNVCLCMCILHVTRHSTLTRLKQQVGACQAIRECSPASAYVK